jgi:hypothetical protein
MRERRLTVNGFEEQDSQNVIRKQGEAESSVKSRRFQPETRSVEAGPGDNS